MEVQRSSAVGSVRLGARTVCFSDRSVDFKRVPSLSSCQAKKAKTLDTVVVATDDERIASLCREHGALVVMTDPDCPNGWLGRGRSALFVLSGRWCLIQHAGEA